MTESRKKQNLFISGFLKICDFLWKHRWFIGIAALLILCLLKINGSSMIDLFQNMGDYYHDRTLGHPRTLRTDEYAVFTPMSISQALTGFQKNSSVWGYSGTNMVLTYGQLAKDFTAFFRPQFWGYLFGVETGLSFFWCSRIIFLFLVTLEFMTKVFQCKRISALCFTALICFSPFVAWWYSVNALVEMMISGEAIVLTAIRFFRKDAGKKKILFAFLLYYLFMWFSLTLYPAWMIPLALSYFTIFIGYIRQNKKEFTFKKSDWIYIALVLLLFAGSILVIYKGSEETIQAMLHTEYPGSRKNTGGEGIKLFYEMFDGWKTPILVFGDPSTAIEFGKIFDFFPLGILMSVYFIIRKKDKLLIWMDGLFIFLLLTGILECPWLQYTPLAYVSPHRLAPVLSLLSLLTFARCIVLLDGFSKCKNAVKTVAYAVTIVGTMAISLLGGLVVNPITVGADAIKESRILEKISELDSDKNAVFAVLDPSITTHSLPLYCGTKCVNACNPYPDEAFWETLGFDSEEDRKIWNRYAHITIIPGEEKKIRQEFLDHVRIQIPLDDLKKVGVNYLLVRKGYYEIDLPVLFDNDNMQIFKLE